MKETSALSRVFGLLVAAATENWGTKIMAFFLAVIVFVVTRGEIERTFTVPLRAIEDPDRVLLTQLPEKVEVSLRGPWANINQLDAKDLGAALLDLREVNPGPMALDPAAIVMPQGVVLDDLDYDPVDLRFEEVVVRRVPVRVAFVGEVDDDYELVRLRVDPERWPVRGPLSKLEAIETLDTEVVDLDGARSDLSASVALLDPGPGLGFVGVATDEDPVVQVEVELELLQDERALELETGPALREALPELAEALALPEQEALTLRGPRSAIRELAEIEEPLQVEVEVGEARRRGAPIPVSLRFTWVDEVPEALRRRVSVEPPLIRLRVSPQGVLDPDGKG
ncbi:hypothetical protein G6O69_26900 [Pseudenhygromyxa sp. WMMC2535]|uniref:CdaR family protein n=1 Tax=Pseudenhygromyxa sp. WMMC2535 TaxID=2712867 RepID=UPI001556DC01|nr:CdaR family protein [Pseudenhygromyxa sp. WMMC2535]NVB41496.1 hypothetical protein [Pseudenhygromyxa sp. WMMC2535]